MRSGVLSIAGAGELVVADGTGGSSPDLSASPTVSISWSTPGRRQREIRAALPG